MENMCNLFITIQPLHLLVDVLKFKLAAITLTMDQLLFVWMLQLDSDSSE